MVKVKIEIEINGDMHEISYDDGFKIYDGLKKIYHTSYGAKMHQKKDTVKRKDLQTKKEIINVSHETGISPTSTCKTTGSDPYGMLEPFGNIEKVSGDDLQKVFAEDDKKIQDELNKLHEQNKKIEEMLAEYDNN